MNVETVSAEVIWHDAECGAYAADLPLWSRLAAEAGSILELGCGTGRVALHLAGRGRRVTAIDRSEELIAELRRRAASAGLELRAQAADASDFDLGERFDLIVAPMQLVQLLDAGERRRCLNSIAANLRSGGKAAIAIVEGDDAGVPESAPLPDVREVDGWVYSSLPLGVRVEDDSLIVERLRQTVAPDGHLSEARSLDRLRIIDAEQLSDEARAAGLRPAERLAVGPTKAHVGSTVVVLEART
jgi:SAM-dependent methyltransferase